MKSMIALFLVLALALFAQDKKENAEVTPFKVQNGEAMHKFYLDTFIQSMGFGRGRMGYMTLLPGQPWQIGEERYRVTNLQLISLLQHNPPAVYPAGKDVANMAENMHQQVVQKTEKEEGVRPLNEFEAAALRQLIEKKSDLVNEGNTKMVGAIRAQASCIKCHEVGEGALLGAFTYTLQKQPAPLKEPQGKPATVTVPEKQAGASQ